MAESFEFSRKLVQARHRKAALKATPPVVIAVFLITWIAAVGMGYEWAQNMADWYETHFMYILPAVLIGWSVSVVFRGGE